MIVFDEFPLASLLDRDLAVDDRLYPNFARLADTSTWYRNATTVAEFTRAALPALLTGLEPEQALLSLTGQRPQSIFTLLEETHALRASRAFPNLCDLSDCPRTPRATGRSEHVLRVVSREPRGASLVAFIENLRRGDEPCLCLLHLILPHSPWRYLPSGQQYPGTDPMPGHVEIPGPGRKWRNQPWLVTQAHQRHLLQVGFVDRLLGEVMLQMESNGVFDEALVVVTGDHGIAFEPGLPKRGATPTTQGDIAWVPLFVKMPEQTEGETVDAPVQSIDVVPAIAEALDVEGARPMDGIPLDRSAGTERRRVLGALDLPHDIAPLRAAVEARFERFPAVRHWLDLFRVAPEEAGRWLGQVVARERIHEVVTASVEVPEAIARASSIDGRLPALVKGALLGNMEDRGDTVAVAIDDRIVAITETYRTPGGERFYALVSPTAYRDPPNSIRLFLIDDGLTEVEIAS